MAAHRVVIVGGGFAGLHTAHGLGKLPVEVTLIDRRNFHLFQPLLYQVATGGLSPANIAAPLRETLKRQKNTRVLLAEATGLDATQRRLLLRDGYVEYDTLIIATGARHHYFGNDAWEQHAPGLKTLEDATELRRRILTAFEEAERESDPARRRQLLTFVVIGAGPTGVEMAGTIADLAHSTLRRNFRSIDPKTATILLVEGTDRVLPAFVPKLSEKAARALDRLGVTVRSGTRVIAMNEESVTLKTGDREEVVATRCVVWAAGVAASPLGRVLRDAAGAELDRAGRVLVGPHCTIPGRPEIFVLGDLAHCRGADGQPLPGVAPVAIQQGHYVSHALARRLRGLEVPPFVYRDKGSMATIGRKSAVADLGWAKFNGTLAWLAWLFVHLLYLVGFQNRLLVLLQWAWNYYTRSRASRLITGAWETLPSEDKSRV